VPDNNIFIQVAAYRDPQLLPTLRDLFANAKYPNNLKVCIAWQCAEGDTLVEYENDPRVELIKIDYRESKGTCWARNLIQQKYKGEEYTLQLDSHHRFIPNWDEEIINMYQGLLAKGVKKPLLTSYIPSYAPETDPVGRVEVPWKMDFDRFTPEGVVFFLPASIDNFRELTEPIKARFYSAHFCFTSGKFCIEVPHDPAYYFHGEEISIAVRAFTHGYDLFHPHKIIAWHEYTRNGRTKHWDDHNKWYVANTQCHLRNRKLFSMDGESYNSIEWGKYGFGTERTLRDYEKYAGLSFSKRSVQMYTLEHKDPPNPRNYNNEEEWENSFTRLFKHCIDIHSSRLPEKDYDFWCVAFKGADDREVYRKDADKAEIDILLKTPEPYKIWRSFKCDAHPAGWVVWPHSISKGWCPMIEGKL
jgi:glycosyltransferase involved in cell wall biosynthesis